MGSSMLKESLDRVITSLLCLLYTTLAEAPPAAIPQQLNIDRAVLGKYVPDENRELQSTKNWI